MPEIARIYCSSLQPPGRDTKRMLCLLALCSALFVSAPLMAQETTLGTPAKSVYVWPQNIIYKRQSRPALVEFSVASPEKTSLWGLKDAAGKVVLPPKYAQVGNIGDGVFLVIDSLKGPEAGKCWLFNSRSGKLSKNSFKYGEQLFEASEGLIGFRKHDAPNFVGYHSLGYYNYDHEIVIPENYQEGSAFHGGLAMVSPEIRGTDKPFRWQFIDPKGNVVAPEIFPVSLFYNGFAIASPLDSTQSERRFGLVNRQFEFVVKPQYLHLQLIAKNIYAAQLNEHEAYFAVSETGKKLFDFLPGFSKFHRYDDAANLIVAEFALRPADPLGLSAAPTSADAVFDLSGKMILPPRYKVSVTTDKIEVYDKAPYGDDGHGTMNFKGEWINPMVYPTQHFNKEIWKSSKAPLGLEVQFALFLQDYDLIGMERNKVEALLGTGNISQSGASYPLKNVLGCGRSAYGFRVEYVDSKVKRWRLYQGMEHTQPVWQTENVIFKPYSGTKSQLVPKAAAF